MPSGPPCTVDTYITVASFNGDVAEVKKLIEDENICVDSTDAYGR